MKPFEIQAENLRASLEYYGHATARGRVIEAGGLCLISSGIDYPVFNIALPSAPITDAPGELDSRIQAAADYYSAQRVPWSLWGCSDYLGARARRRLDTVCDHHGLVNAADSPGMEVDVLPPPGRDLPAVVCRQVGLDAPARDFALLVASSFLIPLPVAEAMYTQPGPWTGALHGWIGYMDGLPVATTATITAVGVTGVYSVSVDPLHRRRGYAEALMRLALEREQALSGTHRIILQSSRAGLSLYRKLGFRTVTRFVVYAQPARR